MRSLVPILAVGAAVVSMAPQTPAADPKKTVEVRFDAAEAEFLLSLTKEKQFAELAKGLLRAKGNVELFADPPTSKADVITLLTSETVSAVVDPQTLEGELSRLFDVLADKVTAGRIADFIGNHHVLQKKGSPGSRQFFDELYKSYTKVQARKK